MFGLGMRKYHDCFYLFMSLVFQEITVNVDFIEEYQKESNSE